MEHHLLRRTLIEHSKDVGPRVANVDDERQPGLAREPDMGPKDPLLILARRPHPEEVETALADPHDERVAEQLLDLGARPRVELARLVGMHAGRGEHAAERLGELERPAARPGVDADANERLDAGRPRYLDNGGRVALEQEQVSGCRRSRPDRGSASAVQGSTRSRVGHPTRRVSFLDLGSKRPGPRDPSQRTGIDSVEEPGPT